MIYAYQLPPLCYAQFFKYLNYHSNLSLSIYQSIYLSFTLHSIYQSINLAVFLSINRLLPFPKYQYIIAADPVSVLLLDFSFDLCLINFHHHATPNFLKKIKLSLSSSIFICQSINRPLPFPKYQSIIAADRGAGIGLVGFFV